MKALKWLFALFAVSILISQSLMDLFSTLFVLTFLGMTIAKKVRWRDLFPRIGAETLWLAWFVVVAISFALNTGHGAPWVTRLVEFKWILILYPMIGYLVLNFPTAAILPGAFCLITLVNVYTLIGWILGRDLVSGSVDSRAQGPFANPMTYAHSTALLFFLLAGLVLEKNSVPAKWRKPLIAVCAMTGLCVLLSFTRGVWIGVAIGGVITAFLYRPKLGAAITGVGVVFIGALLAFWERFRERFFYSFSTGSYDEERWTLWKTNSVIWRENPWFGIGYGENGRRLREYYDRLGVPAGYFEGHAHNQFLHLLAGTGLFGLLCYLAIFAFFIRLNWRLLRASLPAWERGLLWGTLAGQISFLGGGLTEANFEHSKVRFMLMFVWAIVAAISLRAADGRIKK